LYDLSNQEIEAKIKEFDDWLEKNEGHPDYDKVVLSRSVAQDTLDLRKKDFDDGSECFRKFSLTLP